MSQRLLPLALFRGHWKVLSDYRETRTLGDFITRGVVYGGPLLLAAAMWWFDGSFSAPGSLLAGVALLAGGFLSAFTHLSTLRLKLTDRQKDWDSAERLDRDALDETATHLLMAAYTAGVTAALLVIAMNFTPSGQSVVGVFAAVIAATSSFLILLFLVAIPRLYGAYVSINGVRRELSGMHRG